MNTRALTRIEPLPLPDTRRPGLIPSLPEWVRTRAELLKENEQSNPETGQWGSVLTLQKSRMLADTEKQAIAVHISVMEPRLDMTPEKSADAEAAMLVIITKLMKVLPAQKTDAVGYEARAEAYLIALNDVPFWAADEAVRKWYRREHGERDYEWIPSPPTLRELAINEVLMLRARIRQLTNLLNAVPLVEFSEEHREKMIGKVQGLLGSLNAPR